MPPTNHSYRGPSSRPPRFVVANPTNASSLRASVNNSASERGRQSTVLQRTGAELDAFMSALDTVERAGTRLHQLPRERLAQIQGILRNGVSGSDVLVPMPQPAPTAIDHAVRSRLSHQTERRAQRAASSEDVARVGAMYTAEHFQIEGGPPCAGDGLSEAELSSLSTFDAASGGSAASSSGSSDEACCTICLCEMAPGDKCVALACCHVFHYACCAKWLRRSTLCPLCKTHALGTPPSQPPQQHHQQPHFHLRGAQQSDAADGDRDVRAPRTTREDADDDVRMGEPPDDDDVRALLSHAAAAIGASRAATVAAVVGSPMPAQPPPRTVTMAATAPMIPRPAQAPANIIVGAPRPAARPLQMNPSLVVQNARGAVLRRAQ